MGSRPKNRVPDELRRLHRTIEEEIRHYDGLRQYVDYYNERRLHFSLDIANCETPLQALACCITPILGTKNWLFLRFQARLCNRLSGV